MTKLRQRLDAYEKLMRLDRPIGILLLLWPTLWGLWFASQGLPDLTIFWIFLLGTVLMRSAGCAMNDYADRHFDPHVERTRSRPLAQRLVAPWEAVALAAFLALLAFLLVLNLNRLTLWLSVAALFLAATYPFTKRFLSLPQAYLGTAFGFGIPMAYAAVTGQVPAEAWVLLAANMFWSIAYDTEYAMVDRDDDLKIGVRSAAITLGRWDVAGVMVAHGVALGLLAAVGAHLGMGVPFWLGLAAAVALVGWQLRLIRGRDRRQCFRAFLHNNWVGAAVFSGIAADFLVR